MPGGALASGDPDREAQLQRRLEESTGRRGDQQDELRRFRDEHDVLERRLRATERSARARAHAGRALRRDLQAARRALRRARAE